MSSRRKGELSTWRVNQDWPHQVDIIASMVRGSYEAMHDFIRPFSAAPRTGCVRRFDVDYIRFAFAKPEDADAFQLRFGGRRVTMKLVKNRQVDDWGPLGAPVNQEWERAHGGLGLRQAS
jgi:hypothetical protein